MKLTPQLDLAKNEQDRKQNLNLRHPALKAKDKQKSHEKSMVLHRSQSNTKL